MKSHVPKHFRLCALFLLIFFIAVPYVWADPNATISSDGTRLVAEPAATCKVLDTLTKGTRVEVLFVAGFSETVEGFTGGWCAVARGNETGFVFGRYVALDSGAMPIIVGPAYDGRTDRLFYFAETMRRLFGATEAKVRGMLGEPASVWEGGWGKCEGVNLRVLSYPQVEVELFYPKKKCGFLTEEEFVSGVTIKGGDRRILGIGPGSPLEAVREALGPGSEDLALRADLYDLRYVSEDYPQYIIDFIYKKIVKGTAVVRQEVTEVRFSYNVLGD